MYQSVTNVSITTRALQDGTIMHKRFYHHKSITRWYNHAQTFLSPQEPYKWVQSCTNVSITTRALQDHAWTIVIIEHLG